MSDLPSILQEWVNVDPKWRIVKLESRPDRGCTLLSIIHVVDGPELFHASEAEIIDPTDPEQIREAVLDVLDDFGKAEIAAPAALNGEQE